MKKMLKIAISGKGKQVMEMTKGYKSKEALVKKYIYGCTIWHSRSKTVEDDVVGLRMQFKTADQLGWSKRKQSEMFKSVCRIEAARENSRR